MNRKCDKGAKIMSMYKIYAVIPDTSSMTGHKEVEHNVEADSEYEAIGKTMRLDENGIDRLYKQLILMSNDIHNLYDFTGDIPHQKYDFCIELIDGKEVFKHYKYR